MLIKKNQIEFQDPYLILSINNVKNNIAKDAPILESHGQSFQKRSTSQATKVQATIPILPDKEAP